MADPVERTETDVDREITAFRRDRSRYMQQINDHLRAIDALRQSYARTGNKIDLLLDERTDLSVLRLPS